MARRDVWQTLLDYRRLTAWSVSGILPFVTALSGMAPPWPVGIIPLTSLLMITAFLLAYVWLQDAPQKESYRMLLMCFIGFSVAILLYLLAFSTMTFEVPRTNERFVKGFECTEDAILVFGSRCPFLGNPELRTEDYDANYFWTSGSITEARVLLDFLWLAMFIGFSLIITCSLASTSASRTRTRKTSVNRKKAPGQ